MTEPSPLEGRINALEQLARRSKSGRVTRGLTILLLVVWCSLMSVQSWLVFAQFDQLQQNNREHLFWVVCAETATREQRTQAFLKLVEQGHSEWRSARLNGLELQRVDLSRASLVLADLESANLAEGRLTGANLAFSRLRLADLSQADLSHAQLSEANLFKANLQSASLRSANLRAATLEQARAASASFVLADLSDAILLMADFTGADLSGAKLNGADLEAAILKKTQLGLTDFIGGKLKNTDLTDSNWWRARGLTSEQLVEFQRQFAPTEDTDESLRNDYQLWLKNRKSE